MSYSHLSIIERSQLEILHQQGNRARAIARILGRHHATMSRELCRNAQQKSYQAERSQENDRQRRKGSVPNGKWRPEQAFIIEEKLDASWSQRGSNENANGLLREFFPKGTDFAQVREEELARALALINLRPRKCLGWNTAHESFAQELSHLA